MNTRKTLFIALLSINMAQAQNVLPKVKHAEPLYMDLVRDLGAKRGEKEWNIGAEISHHRQYTSHSSFIEYEFAPLNRLGFEIEVPFTFYRIHPEETGNDPVPRNRMEGIKLATQYTFLVSEQRQLSAALLYSHEFMFHSFYTMNAKQLLLKAQQYSPAIIIAKRWGTRFHSLVYVGPEWIHAMAEHGTAMQYQLNTSMHYALPASRHLIGVEINEEFRSKDHMMIIRPQTKLALSNAIALGIITGIPVDARQENISFMVRFIYEPATN